MRGQAFRPAVAQLLVQCAAEGPLRAKRGLSTSWVRSRVNAARATIDFNTEQAWHGTNRGMAWHERKS